MHDALLAKPIRFEQLKRDNITLVEDQKAMRALTHKLEQAIKLGQLIDADPIATILPADGQSIVRETSVVMLSSIGMADDAIAVATPGSSATSETLSEKN